MINTMNIVYATDSNYVSICAASMVSLLESNRACKEINIFLYGDRLGTNECILENLVSRYDRYINIIQAVPIVKSFEKMNVPKVNGSYSAYVRLAVSKNLDNIDKFIYIDCDTLILQNLEELWDTDIDGYAVGGVSDAMSARCNLALGKGIEDLYINLGVLLVNAKYWRMNNVLEKMIQDLNKYRLSHTATGGDQEMINYTLFRRIYKLPLKYNVLVQNRIYDPVQMRFMIEKNDKSYYSISEMKEARERPYIVHFANSSLIRPWFANSQDPLSKMWDYYLSLTGYSYDKRKLRISLWQKMCVVAFYLLPDKGYAILKRYEDRLKHYYLRTHGRR